jgi:hypothetical protein
MDSANLATLDSRAGHPMPALYTKEGNSHIPFLPALKLSTQNYFYAVCEKIFFFVFGGAIISDFPNKFRNLTSSFEQFCLAFFHD